MVIDLPEDTWVRIMNCMSNASYREVSPLIDIMVKQIQLQKTSGQEKI